MNNSPNLILPTRKVLEDEKAWNEYFQNLTPEQQLQIAKAVEGLPRIGPLPGPQTLAYNSTADIIGFGGRAGGGKSGCGILKILTQHTRCLAVRFDKSDLTGFIDDLTEKYGSDVGLNRQDGHFYFADRPGHKLDYGGIGKPGAEHGYDGNPHDFMFFDETQYLEEQKVMYMRSWNRTTIPGQFCQTMLAFNPPDTAEGMWLIDFFAPWIDPTHPLYPAEPGKLLYFMRNAEGDEIIVPDKAPRKVRLKDGKDHTIIPESRTFIPATLEDNPYLMNTGYANRLLNRDAKERDRLYLGQFTRHLKAQPQQVILGEHVDAAMERWREEGGRYPMDSAGVDVAEGGAARTVISPRHRLWFAKQTEWPGKQTIDPFVTAELLMTVIGTAQPVVSVDVVGAGSGTNHVLKRQYAMRCDPVKSQTRLGLPILDPDLKFYNVRAVLWWFFRMLLDPANELYPALPRDKDLRKELVAPTYTKKNNIILIEDKKEISKRLNGQSIDKADALIYNGKSLLWSRDPLVIKLLDYAHLYQDKDDARFQTHAPAHHRPGGGKDTWMAR